MQEETSEYKNIYEYVTIKYDSLQDVYILVTNDNKIIGIAKSQEEANNLLKELDITQKEYANQTSNSSTYNTGKPKKKINMYIGSIIDTISKLEQIANASYDCNMGYANSLTGELKAFYNGLNDNTKEELAKLGDMVNGISQSTEASLAICLENNNQDYQELKKLIDELYNMTDEIVKNRNETSQDEPLSYDDYSYLFDNMSRIFDGRYQDILDNFKLNLIIGYQQFLGRTVPETIDNLVENTYLRISDEEIGSKEYYEGLNKYKETFSFKILSDFNIDNFNIEESNIPKYLWDEADDYNKSLLVLSYNNDNFSNNYRDNIIKTLTISAKENDLEYTYIEDDLQSIKKSFNILEKTNSFYNRDFDKEYSDLNAYDKLKEIIKEYDNLIKDDIDTGMSKEVFYTYIAANPIYNKESGEAWEKTLKEFGYLDKIEGKYETDVLYNETFSNEFIGKIVEEEGQDKVYQVLKSFYKNYGLEDGEVEYKLDSLFRGMDPYLLNTVINYNLNNELQNNLNITYNQLVSDKLTIDASKTSYKLGLLESIDTRSITEEDMVLAKNIIGNDSKYLEDWQIKGFYKIYQEDSERAKGLLNDTLYNIIQDGKGYEQAVNTYNLMTGEEQKKLLNGIIHNEIFNDIWGKSSGFIYTGIQGFTDGVGNSIRTVADLVLADGKMDSQDYYLAHLQEILSKGGTHNDLLKLEYNLSSSVGNMAIPMALSAFVSPAAMSAWIFASTVGSEREQTLRSGKEEDVGTWLNATAKGLLAVGTEKFLGSLKGYGAKEDELLKVFTSDNELITKFMGTSFGKTFAKTLSNSVNETIEELVENAGGYGIDFLTGRDIDLGNIPKETWETIYMTMLTTPFINMMGEGFQNNKYSTINKMNIYNLNGFDIECSQSEIMRFTDNQGNIDNKRLFNYLLENDRINNVNNALLNSDRYQTLKSITDNRLTPINKISNSFDNWMLSNLPEGSDSVPVGDSYDTKVSNVINFINNKYGDDSAIRRLTEYIQTGNIKLITRDGNCRSIIQDISMKDLKSVLSKITNNQTQEPQNTKVVSNIVDFINNKYGDDSAIGRLTEYIQTGNIKLITRDGNCREIISGIPIDELQSILLQINKETVKNIHHETTGKYKSITDVVKNTKNEIYSIRTINKIERAVNNAKINGGAAYSALVRINSDKAKTLPTDYEVAKYKSRFENEQYNISDFQRGVFSHIKSLDFHSKSGRITDRLYINTSSCSDTINFVTMFADECEKREIPFYFKTADMFYGADKIDPRQLTRDESVVIYSDANHLADYVNICNEIKEKTGINLEAPPILSGIIDDNIGYGQEPMQQKESYNSLRAGLVDKAFDDVNESIANYNNIDISNSDNLYQFVNWIRQDPQRYNAYLYRISQKIYDKCSSYGIDSDSFFLNSK